jgi:PAS domain S-box-containing protein
VKEKIFDGTINPVFENGKIVSTVGCFRDITLEKTAEELLKESEKNYKTLIENISDAFFIITTDYKFKYINENGARLLGSTAEKIIGERVYHILARDDVNISYPELKEVVNKGIFLNREGYAKLKGRTVWA